MKTFVSFAQEDHRLSHLLAASLIERGIEPVIAVKVRKPGRRLDEKVIELIKTVYSMIVIWTKYAVTNEWVQQEIGAAKTLGKVIVPVKTRTVRISGMLQGIEYASFTLANPEVGFGEAADGLASLAREMGIELGPATSSDLRWEEWFQLLHLPAALKCPGCKQVDNHVFLCLLCGDWVCADCGETIPPQAYALPSRKKKN